MAEYLIQGETLTGIADAIRGKTGGTDPVAVSDMAAQIAGIQAGGGDIDALIDRSLTEIESNVKSVGANAFNSCKKLTKVNFPEATSVGADAFNSCKNLTTANFPEATSVGANAFSSCKNLTTANFPEATSVGANAFSSCNNLTTANFPLITSIGDGAFSACIKLTTADFPLITSIGDGVFQNCYVLTTADFPLITSIGDSAFQNCYKLTTANFPVATSIGSYAFYSCSALTTLMLRSETMVTLKNQSAFISTPIKSGTGYIYVPRALIEGYKVASNWSTYAAQFRALEDYTVDGTATGELDPTKTGT